MVEARLAVLNIVKGAALEKARQVRNDGESGGGSYEGVGGGGLERVLPAVVDNLVAALERGKDVDVVYAAARTVNIIRD